MSLIADLWYKYETLENERNKYDSSSPKWISINYSMHEIMGKINDAERKEKELNGEEFYPIHG